MSCDSLSAGLVAAIRGLDESLGGLGSISGLLADHSDAALLVGNNTNSLVIPALALCRFALERLTERFLIVARMYLVVDETGML